MNIFSRAWKCRFLGYHVSHQPQIIWAGQTAYVECKCSSCGKLTAYFSSSPQPNEREWAPPAAPIRWGDGK